MCKCTLPFSINQSTNQPTNQPINQSINLSTELTVQGREPDVTHQTYELVHMQEYWPPVRNFAEQYATSDLDKRYDIDSGEGVKQAEQASQAGVKPPSAVGPFTSDSSQPAQGHHYEGIQNDDWQKVEIDDSHQPKKEL